MTPREEQNTENLAKLLKSAGASKEGTIAIMLVLETDEQDEAMLDWMTSLKKAPTENEALVKALKIRKNEIEASHQSIKNERFSMKRPER